MKCSYFLCIWYIAFSKLSVLILFFYFDLPLLNQSAGVKVTFSLNFRRSTKEAVLLLLSWSTMYTAFSKCIGSSLSFVLFLFSTIYPKCIHKDHLFLKLFLLCERRSDIISFKEQIYVPV